MSFSVRCSILVGGDHKVLKPIWKFLNFLRNNCSIELEGRGGLALQQSANIDSDHISFVDLKEMFHGLFNRRVENCRCIDLAIHNWGEKNVLTICVNLKFVRRVSLTIGRAIIVSE